MKDGVATMRDIEEAAREHERKGFEALGMTGDEAMFGLSKEETKHVMELVRIGWQDGFQAGFAFSEAGGKLNIHPEDDELRIRI